MRFFNANAMIRVLTPFIAGILSAYWLMNIISFSRLLIILISLSICISIWCFRPLTWRKYRYRHLSAIAFSTWFYLLGFSLFQSQTPEQQQTHYLHYPTCYQLVRLQINGPITEKANSYKTTAQITALQDSLKQKWIHCSGDILLYFDKDKAPALDYGDEIVAHIRLNPIQSAHNPYAFDYADFMAKQGIYEQAFVKNTDWKLLHKNKGNSLKALSIKARSTLLSILKSYGLPTDEQAVAAAILLGYDDYIDPELRQQFAGSGALHVLCVSGLHVGIIYMIFNLLFGFMRHRKWSSYLYYILLTACIWAYAFITGLAAPVLRASTMFSLIIIGKLLHRQSSVYNSLAASAFLLLLFQPALIFNVGFQFSYLSVLSIFFFQPKISKIYRSRYSIINKLIDLSAVSIAAQLGLFPLSIYYFHLFPHYFLLSNIAIIPLSFAILLSGIGNFIVYLSGFAISYLGYSLLALLHILLWLLTHITKWIQSLPWAFSENLYFSTLELWLLYAIIIFGSAAILYKKYISAMLTLTLCLCLTGYKLIATYQSSQQCELHILHDNKAPCISIIQGNTQQLIAYGAQTPDLKSSYASFYALKLHKRIKHLTLTNKRHINNILENDIDIHPHYLLWGKTKMGIINKDVWLPKNTLTTTFDICILTGNPNISIAFISQKIQSKLFVFDATNTHWRIKKWQNECDSLGFQHHNIKVDGAYAWQY